MLIEIAGIPGSGKSNFFKTLRREFMDNDIVTTDINTIAQERSGAADTPRFVREKPDRELLYRFTRFSARHPEFTRIAEGFFDSETQRRFLFHLLAASFQKASDLATADEVVFLDEGFMNHCVAILPTEEKRDELLALLRIAPPVDVLVFIDTPADIAFERAVGRRGGGEDIKRRVEQKYGGIDKFRERREAFKAGLNTYGHRCSSAVVVDGTKSADVSAKRVFDHLISSLTPQEP